MNKFFPVVMTLALVSVCGCQGCTRSAALPPPTASIPAPYTPPPVVKKVIPATPAVPVLAESLWKPTVKARTWKYLVIHHTATSSGSVESIHAEHQKKKDKNGNPWIGIGYHFVIGNGKGMGDGEIEPTFRWRTQLHGAHAGSSDPEYNQLGVGICLVGNFENEAPTTAQMQSVRALVRALRNEYFIPSDHVVPHKEIRAAATACPGKLFPLAEVAGDFSNPVIGFEDLSGNDGTIATSDRRTLR